jgi:hypothetical protein
VLQTEIDRFYLAQVSGLVGVYFQPQLAPHAMWAKYFADGQIP